MNFVLGRDLGCCDRGFRHLVRDLLIEAFLHTLHVLRRVLIEDAAVAGDDQAIIGTVDVFKHVLIVVFPWIEVVALMAKRVFDILVQLGTLLLIFFVTVVIALTELLGDHAWHLLRLLDNLRRLRIFRALSDNVSNGEFSIGSLHSFRLRERFA